jgi:hypothetical protein
MARISQTCVAASFCTVVSYVRCALGFFGFGLSAKAPLLHSSGYPQRLTIRSSRRRVLAALKLSTVRAILAAHCRGRRGLTRVLGGRKAFCGFVARKPEFIDFGLQCSSDGLSAAFFFGCSSVRAQAWLA